MATQPFNAAATVLQPYVFDLDREVAEFYRDHPEQKNRIFYIDGSTLPGALYRGDEKDEDDVTEILGSNPALLLNNKTAFESGSRSDLYPKQGYGTVLLNLSKKNQQNLLGYTAPAGQSEAFVFDHETGHLLCEKGLDDNTNLGECVADAYAVLRHIQRFGKDSTAIRTLVGKRAVEMMLGGCGDHFTSPVVEKIIADSQKTDFSAMTPAETVERAQRYAEDNAVETNLLRRMISDFGILNCGAADLVMKGDPGVIRYMADFALHPTVPEEAKWAAIAVRTLLDGDVGIDGVRLQKPVGEEWTKLRQAIDARTTKSSQPQPKLIIVSSL